MCQSSWDIQALCKNLSVSTGGQVIQETVNTDTQILGGIRILIFQLWMARGYHVTTRYLRYDSPI